MSMFRCSIGASNEPSSFARFGGNGESRQNSSVSGYENEAAWDEEPQEQEELHPSTAAAMAIAQADGDVNELQVHDHIYQHMPKQRVRAASLIAATDFNSLLVAQDAVANIQRQAHARARAKGMSSGYAAMSNSLLRKALKAPR